MTAGLRERKKAETREALAATALRLALEHGPDQVTVDAIAAEVGVSQRTFFNYFATKEDAILGNSSSSAPVLLEALVNRPRREPLLVSLRAVLHESTDHLQSDPDQWIARNRLARANPELSVRYAARLAGIEQGLVVEIGRRTGLDPDRDPYPSVVAGAVLAATRAALTIWQEHGPEAALSGLIDRVFDILEAGLSRR